MKKELLKLMETDGKKALAFYFENINKIKGVYYNASLFDTTIIRFLTINDVDYEVDREELILEQELV